MDVRLPRLGEGADSGTVASIFVKEGDQVAKDQPILELESEKAVASIPSPASGTVTKLHIKEGDEIKVGQMIISLDEGRAPKESAPGKTRDVAAEVAVERERAGNEDEMVPGRCHPGSGTGRSGRRGTADRGGAGIARSIFLRRAMEEPRLPHRPCGRWRVIWGSICEG